MARDERPTAAGVEGLSEPAAADAESTEDEDPGDSDAAAEPADEPTAEPADATPQSPRELEEAGGFGLGGAEQIDGLLDDCESGSDLACDVLYQLSGFDSPEETTALTCAGRNTDQRVFCTDGIEPADDELFFDTTSEGLDAIVTLCEVDGDMTACDFLYFRSPIGSDFEEIGGTCGDRVAVAVPDCRTFME